MLYIIVEKYNKKGECEISEPYYIPRNDVLYGFFLYYLIKNPGKEIKLIQDDKEYKDFDVYATPFLGFHPAMVYREKLTA